MKRKLKMDVGGDGFFYRAGNVLSEKRLVEVFGQAGCERFSEPVEELAIKSGPVETAVKRRRPRR